MSRAADMHNVDPDEHTCTRGEWNEGVAPLPMSEPVELFVCEPCGRSFVKPQRMVNVMEPAEARWIFKVLAATSGLVGDGVFALRVTGDTVTVEGRLDKFHGIGVGPLYRIVEPS